MILETVLDVPTSLVFINNYAADVIFLYYTMKQFAKIS